MSEKKHTNKPTQIYPQINLSLMDSYTEPSPNGFVVCVCVFLDLFLGTFMCGRTPVAAAAQPGIKTAMQTDWGSGSDSTMSKHKLSQSVMNQRRDHDAALHHLASSTNAQPQPPA